MGPFSGLFSYKIVCPNCHPLNDFLKKATYYADGAFKFARHKVARYFWETKDYEQWLVLQLMLYKIKPKNIVEFGGGRSTSYIAEYAFKKQAMYTSIEENWFFAKRLQSALTFSRLPGTYIRWVPIKDDWYDVSRLGDLLIQKVDVLFIDGPTGMGKGKRDSKKGIACLKKLAQSASVIIVDDINNANVSQPTASVLQAWKNGTGYIYKDHRKPSKSNVAYFVRAGLVEEIDSINTFIGLKPVKFPLRGKDVFNGVNLNI